ncbi:fungal specific transcription factor domain-containing protein [Seiridium cupressi]
MPALLKTSSSPSLDARESISRTYDVTKNGFLPSAAPVRQLTDPYYSTWELLVQNLPDLLKGQLLRQVVDGCQVLSTENLRSEGEWRRAYAVLVFLMHGYIWGGETPSEDEKILPPQITVPLLKIAEHFDLPPCATYAGLVLWNFESSSEDFSDLDSLHAINTFTGTEDESWFYMLSVALEAQSAWVMPLMVDAIEATHKRDYAAIAKGLEQITIAIKKMDKLLTRMYEKCDPALFYDRIRPFLAGSANMEAAGLPNGVFYDEGNGKGSWRRLMGGSNGQSSLIQFFDVVLGVNHTGGADKASAPATCPVSGMAPSAGTSGCPVKAAKEKVMGYHEKVRAYMPEPHRRFLEDLAHMGSLQEFASTPQPDAEFEKMKGLYQVGCKAMGDFRSTHIKVVTRYIVIQASKQPVGKTLNLAKASSQSGDSSELKGTGGTSLSAFLRQSRDESYAAGLVPDNAVSSLSSAYGCCEVTGGGSRGNRKTDDEPIESTRVAVRKGMPTSTIPPLIPAIRDRAIDTWNSVKCDGKLPCSYCTRHKKAQSCHFTPQKRRRLNSVASPASDQDHQQQYQRHPTSPRSSVQLSAPPETASNHHSASTSTPSHVVPTVSAGPTVGSAGPALRDTSVEEEAEVPRDARLLYDAQGKLIFIGDCAPLSFFQTVRQLVLSRIDPQAFAHHTSRVSVLQNVPPSQAIQSGHQEPFVDVNIVHSIVGKYLAVTSGLVDLFGTTRLADDISNWANERSHDVHAAVNYLVLAVGLQSVDDSLASSYFEHAKVLALATLGSELSVGTVQAFTLITLYMLRACQITGAYLFFGWSNLLTFVTFLTVSGIAVRAVYSIGAHRTEVNSRFGVEIHKHRDRLWKSVRIVDLFLSISMGRPPATSDVDCTVPYREMDTTGKEVFDLLDSSVQVLLIIESIVLEVFSRKKISLQLTEGISRQLRSWSNRWLIELKRIVGAPPGQEDEDRIVGACHVLCSYYYAVMLVSRPFLMYEMCRRLPENPSKIDTIRESGSSGRSKLANASIDAGSLMIESVFDLVQSGILDGCMPLIVSWMFAASLVVGVGLLGDFGRILEKDVRMSITALEHFAKHDAHALQYSLIIKSLHASATEYLERKERYERLQISESSSQLFGLTPRQPREASKATPRHAHDSNSFHSPAVNHSSLNPGEAIDSTRELGSSFFDDLDPSIFPFIHSSSHTPELPIVNGIAQNSDQVFGALNLFPLLEEGGHIDLAHYISKEIIMSPSSQRKSARKMEPGHISKIGKTTASLESSEHRDMLDIIDTLRSQGASRYIDLPQIIVCGDQSSGKSSVLEAISGVDFPTKDGLCTRFATELVLRRSDNDEIRIYIIPGPTRTEKEKAKLSKFRLTTDSGPVGNAIDQAQSAMEDAGDNMPNFFTDVLRVEISGPHQPHLTLVDLPGLFLASNSTQSARDAHMVENMVLSYMKKPRSIILSVVSASNEFVLQQVTQRARELDPTGKRTLGLITKPDKLDPASESERSYVELAQNKNVKLDLGWHVLRNRSFAEIKDSSTLRDSRETLFFEQEPWSCLPQHCKGVSALRTRLSTVLRDQILSHLPSVTADVKAGLKDSTTQLNRLGAARPSLAEQRAYLLRCSQEFTGLITAAVKGYYAHNFFYQATDNTKDVTRLRAIIQRELKTFSETMQVSGHRIEIVDNASEVGPGQQGREDFLKEVKEVMKAHRGLELPGMANPAVVGELFRRHSEPWEDITGTAMIKIKASASEMLIAALDATVTGPANQRIRRQLIETATEKLAHSLDSKVNDLLEPHQYGHPITYNHYLTENVQKAQAARYERKIEAALHQAIPNINVKGGSQSVVMDPRLLLNSITSMTEPDMDNFACEQAIDMMEAYYKVALKKFIDDVSVDGVEQCLMRKLPEIFSVEAVSQLGEDDIHRLASESKQARAERGRLEGKRLALEDALVVLHRISTLRD